MRPDDALHPEIAADLRRQPWLTPDERLAILAARYVTENECERREEEARSDGYSDGYSDGENDGGRAAGDALADAIELVLDDEDCTIEELRERIEAAVMEYRNG